MTKPLSYHIGRFFLSSLIGAIGGAVAGITIVLIGGILSALFANTHDDLLSAVETAIVGGWVGAFVGAFVVPIAYVLLLHRVGFTIAVVPTYVGTVAFSLLAALFDSDSVIWFGIVGFFVALYATWWIDRAHSQQPLDEIR